MIKYPILATTLATKYAFVKRSIELMRIEHNIMGDWFDPEVELIPLVKYQLLRAAVQTAFPYDDKKLNKIDWERYLAERFDIKMKILTGEEGRLKSLLYSSNRFSPNLDDDIS